MWRFCNRAAPGLRPQPRPLVELRRLQVATTQSTTRQQVLERLLFFEALALSLLVRRRRVWVRVASGASGITVVDVAGLTRSEHASVADEVDEVASVLGSPAAASTAQGSTEAEGAPE